jgi:selenocysteine lyase/cysteine desulfurase
VTGPTTHPDGTDVAAAVAAVQPEFAPEVVYLDTATLGLPPRRALDALEASLDAWRRGRLEAGGFDVVVDAARRRFAALVGVDPGWVAVGNQVSPFVGLVAASLPPGSEVLVAADEFTSVSFPFLAQPGVTVREVGLRELPDAVTAATAWVAVAAAQSADGALVDAEALLAACAATGTRTLLDATQAAGWSPVDASRWSVTVTGGYKWLLAPRGTAFLTVRPEVVADLVPAAAGWYAGADRWSSLYGGPLRLADDARRFDVSPAWQAWVGQAASLELLLEVGVPALHAHAVGLAARFCDALDLPHTGSAIVSVRADDQVPARLDAAGIRAAGRAGRLRLSFHVSTSVSDVDRAVEVLAGHVRA